MMPILALIIFGIIDFGRPCLPRKHISACAKGRVTEQSCRAASTTGQSEIRDTVRSVSRPFGGDTLRDDHIEIEFDGELVTVRVDSFPFQPLTPTTSAVGVGLVPITGGHVPLGSAAPTRIIGRRTCVPRPGDRIHGSETVIRLSSTAAVFHRGNGDTACSRASGGQDTCARGDSSRGRRFEMTFLRRLARQTVARGEALARRGDSEDAFGSLDAAASRVTRMAVFVGEAICPTARTRGTAQSLKPAFTRACEPCPCGQRRRGRVDWSSRKSRECAGLMRENGTKGSEEVSKLFLADMRVLSMGCTHTRDASGEATPARPRPRGDAAQAERLAVAMRQGMIQLVLRGFDDADSSRTKGASSSEVLAGLRDAKPAPVVAQAETRPSRPAKRLPETRVVPPPVAVAPPVVKPDSLTVRVYRGSQVSQQKFQVDTANGNGTP